jgi:hypothetical protein
MANRSTKEARSDALSDKSCTNEWAKKDISNVSSTIVLKIIFSAGLGLKSNHVGTDLLRQDI